MDKATKLASNLIGVILVRDQFEKVFNCAYKVKGLTEASVNDPYDPNLVAFENSLPGIVMMSTSLIDKAQKHVWHILAELRSDYCTITYTINLVYNADEQMVLVSAMSIRVGNVTTEYNYHEMLCSEGELRSYYNNDPDEEAMNLVRDTFVQAVFDDTGVIPIPDYDAFCYDGGDTDDWTESDRLGLLEKMDMMYD